MTLEPSGDRPRLHGLDAVRGFAFLATVAFHAGLSFLPGPQIWVTRDTPDMGVADFVVISHMSHLLIFFLLAGLFARMSLERRGVRPFIRDRLLRITLPAIVFWPFIIVGVIATFAWGAFVAHPGGAPAPAAPPPMEFPLTHLWFLYVLTLIYAGALAVVGLGRAIDRSGRLGAAVFDPAMRWLTATRLLAPLLAFPVALLFLSEPGWTPSMGIPTPDHGFVPNRIAAASYALAFWAGWLLQRQPGLLQGLRRDWLGYCAAAAVASVLLLAQIKPAQFLSPAPAFPHPAWLAAAYAVAAWCWTFGLIGAGLRFLGGEHPAVRYVSDASYWIYIVHLPLVTAALVWVYPWHAPALLKFGVVIVGCFVVLFATYHLLVRHSWIGRWLNGRKVPWGKPRAAGKLGAATA
jgi:peptidoglycan/LPS O-acetylase OafA/YrhL